MGALKAYVPRDNKYIEAKNKLVNNVENFYKGRKKTIEGFKNGVFPVYHDERHQHQMKAEKEIEEEEQEKQQEQQENKKNKKKNQKKANFLNILKMNQKA